METHTTTESMTNGPTSKEDAEPDIRESIRIMIIKALTKAPTKPQSADLMMGLIESAILTKYRNLDLNYEFYLKNLFGQELNKFIESGIIRLTHIEIRYADGSNSCYVTIPHIRLESI